MSMATKTEDSSEYWMKWIRAFSTASAAVALGYLILISTASLKQGYAWAEMGWDQKGQTTPADFLATSDIEGEKSI